MRFKRVMSGVMVLLCLALIGYAQEPVKEPHVSKQPFIDLQRTITDLRAQKRIDLDTPFHVGAKFTLDRNGNIDPSTLEYVRSESTSSELLNVVKQGIEAINKSSVLQYLSNLTSKEIQIEVRQDGQTFSFALESELQTDLRSKALTSLFNTFVEMKRREMETKESPSKDTDDLFLLQNAKSSASGKIWKLSMSFPKAEFWKMMERRFTEQKTTTKNKSDVKISAKPLSN